MTNKKTTKNIIDVIHAEISADHEFAKMVEEVSFNAEIARQVYDARTNAGLTQAQLAERAGTKQSVISRIEDNVYVGHSLATLKRIADALGLHLRIRFCEQPSKQKILK